VSCIDGETVPRKLNSSAFAATRPAKGSARSCRAFRYR
jgi:hypothetical protein